MSFLDIIESDFVDPLGLTPFFVFLEVRIFVTSDQGLHVAQHTPGRV
jgi:hypothetical protein